MLGAAFGQNLFDALVARHATSVLVVPGGILGTLPLTTAIVDTGDGAVPISDTVAVSITPSAYVHQVCAQRSERRARMPRLLVCVADPDPQRPLPWSRSEVDAIGRIHSRSEQRIADGPGATRDFLRTHAGRASHLHLALHGSSDAADAMASNVGMADGPMTVAELRESTKLTTQVVVVSACESGRISVGDGLNEFRGLPFALIACGAAAVVASLWQVNDLATSLLMVRFHQELVRLEVGNGPTADRVGPAPRSAQAWLRSATAQDIARFRARHGLVRRGRLPDAGLRGDSPSSGGPNAAPEGHRPFSAPQHWAAFVAIG